MYDDMLSRLHSIARQYADKNDILKDDLTHN